MRICKIEVQRFRGIKTATILLPQHTVLIGDNNCGKTTVLEALDLVLGPDRLNKQPPINEHDFYQSVYRLESRAGSVDPGGESDAPANGPESGAPATTHGAGAAIVPSDQAAPQVEITVTTTGLSREQTAHFGPHLEFWDSSTKELYRDPDAAGVDKEGVTPAIRATFVGQYDAEEDDFSGRSYFTRSMEEDDSPTPFSKRDKRMCGFLYLRSLRTGSRALSLDRGSLLDIILRVKEVRPQMWEGTIRALARHDVAADPELGISPILETIGTALRKYVPAEWGVNPHLRVSSLTRDHLRGVITAFIATGVEEHSAPFYLQGRGTINVLVLALLSEVAASKGNVIFAMEEPETAIPPYAQKRIVHEVRTSTAQSIFTSHSPYVVEEFDIGDVLVLERSSAGKMATREISLPSNLKLKRYQQEFRTRFAEGLFAPRILLAEGATEATAFPAVCRRLAEINADRYLSLEALGICTLNAGGETELPGLGRMYSTLGKRVFAVCDHQTEEQKQRIEESVDLLLMHDEKGFEDLVLHNTTDDAIRRFLGDLELPEHLLSKFPDMDGNEGDVLRDYFAWSKGSRGVADFLCQCSEAEIPDWIRNASVKLKDVCTQNPAARDEGATAATHEASVSNGDAATD